MAYYVQNEPQSIPRWSMPYRVGRSIFLKKTRRAGGRWQGFAHPQGGFDRIHPPTHRRRAAPDALGRLDPVQQAAVAEVVHGPDARFNAGRFEASTASRRIGVRTGPITATPRCWAYFSTVASCRMTCGGGLNPSCRNPNRRDCRLREIPDEWALTYKEWDQETRQQKVYRNRVPIIRCLTERGHSRSQGDAAPDRCRQAGGQRQDLPARCRAPNPGRATARRRFLRRQRVRRIRQDRPDQAVCLAVAGAGRRIGFAERQDAATQQDRTKSARRTGGEAIAQIWRRWQKTTLIDELRRIDCIKGQTGKGKRGLTAVAGRRAAIHQALQHCPAGRWIAVNDLFRQMRATGADLR